MSDKTGIEWTDATFNPWWGCSKVSPGCDNCYAESIARRFHAGIWGAGADSARRVFDHKHWNAPLGWNKRAAAAGKRMRVFCASMADVFDNHPGVDDERDQLWTLIHKTPNLDWQLLTKRVSNVKRMVPPSWLKGHWPRNAWLGISVVNQEETDRDIPKLLELPASVRFLSCEPLLGPIDLTRVYGVRHCAPFNALNASQNGYVRCVQHAQGHCLGDCPGRLPALSWVIVGGESGPGARPCVIGHVREIVRQCQAAGIPVLVKQLGAKPTNREGQPHQVTGKGGDMAEWPEDLRVRAYPPTDRNS